MTLLLDTSVLIDVLNGRRDRRALLVELVKSGHLLSTTVINMAEVYAGMRKEEEVRTSELFRGLACHSLEPQVARKAGILQSVWARKGTTLKLPDAIIAATAIELGLTLMTDNRKDFPMREIKLYPLPQ